MTGLSQMSLRHLAARPSNRFTRRREGREEKEGRARAKAQRPEKPSSAQRTSHFPDRCGCAATKKEDRHVLNDAKDFASFAPSRDTPFLPAQEALKAHHMRLPYPQREGRRRVSAPRKLWPRAPDRPNCRPSPT